MKNFLIGFFLSFCFLLLNGFSQLSAQQCQDSTWISPFKLLNHEAAGINEYLTIKSASRRANNHHVLWLEQEEKEEDESSPSTSSYSTADFFNQTALFIFSNTRKVLSFYKHIPFTASYRYVILQVFRI